MKNTKIFAALMIMCAVAACAKEDPKSTDNTKDNQGGSHTVKTAIEFSFEASHSEMVLSKTEVSEGPGDNASVLWKSTDKVSIFDDEDNNCEFSAGSAGASTTLIGSLIPKVSGDYYSVYPYNASNSISGTTVTTTLPATQTVSAPGFADGAVLSAAVANDAAFSYKNLVALVRFTVPAEMTTLHSVTLASAAAVAGECTVSFAAATPVIAATGSSVTSVTVEAAGASGVLATGNYYAAVIPGSHQFSVTLTDTDGKSVVKSMTAARDFVAGHIRGLGSVDTDTFYNDVDIVLGDAAVTGETSTLVRNVQLPAGSYTVGDLVGSTSYTFKGDKGIYVIGNKAFTVTSSSVKQTVTIEKTDLSARHWLVREGDDLQAVINAAEPGLDDVYVGAGTFTGGFTMAEGINLTGSWNAEFSSTISYEPLKSTSGITTILDGGGSQRVVNQAADFTESTRTTWKNLKISNGSTDTGAGVYLQAYGVLDGCEITGNVSTGDGAGVLALNWAATTRCYIHNNTAGGSGGGILTRYVLSYSLVDSNQAKGSGGAYVYAGGYSGENVERPRIFNCIISNNKATGDNGGGVRANRGSSNPLPVLYNLLVVGNTATGWAGSGILVNAGCVYNCTVVKNYTSATQDNANALYNATNYSTDTEKGRIQNCIAFGNWTAGKNADTATQIYMNSTGGLRNNSTSANGQWKAKAAYEYVTRKDVTEAFFTDYANGDYTLSGNNADCISGGTLNGLSGLWSYLPKTDIAGNNRLYNGDTQIGRGCYQYQD